MAPRSPVGVLSPDGGVQYSGRVCAGISALLRAGMRENHRKGLPTGPDLLVVVQMAEQAAADYQRRQQPVSAGTSVLAPVISASPRSDWVDVSQAALALGLTGRQVRNLCYSGKLRAAQDSRRWWRIDPTSIERYKARRAYGQGEQQGSDSG